MATTTADSPGFRLSIFAITVACIMYDAAVLAQQPAVQSAGTATQSWEVIYLGDKRVGYTRYSVESVPDSNPELLRTIEDTRMMLKRFGQTIQMDSRLVTLETQTGRLRSFDLSMDNPPADSVRTTGEVDGTQLKTTTVVSQRTRERSQPWESEMKSSTWPDRSLRASPIKPGEKRRMRIFNVQLNKASNVSIYADQVRRTRMLNGKSARLLKVRMTQSALPTLKRILWLDESGTIQKTEMDFLGSSLVSYRVDETEAMQALSGAELDIAVNTLLRIDKPLKNGHRVRRAVYRLTSDDANALKALTVNRETQTARQLRDDMVELTVTVAKEPTGILDRTVPKQYLEATQFLQSNDARVAEHAGRAASGQLNAWKTCKAMELYVYRNLRRKNFSTALASAAEVARDLSGDCTEHAVLLAAMLRNRNIPSRIAVGLVYVESQLGFGGHMWTEALLDGRWIPLDATLGRGGIGAAHIKLADSAFADDGPNPVSTFLPLFNLLGNVKIEVVSAK